MSERMPIEQVIAGFDDEALSRTMIATAAQGIVGLFNAAPPRIQGARDRVVALMEAAPDLLDFVRDLARQHAPNGPEKRCWACGLSGDCCGVRHRAVALLAKAEPSR